VRVADLVALARDRFDAPPAEADLEALARALADLEDDGLDLDARLRGGVARAWVGEDVADAPHGHVSLFLLPPAGAIPLHDHPGMTVLTRVLRGRVRVRAWDWLLGPPRTHEAAFARPALDVTLDARSPVLWTRPGAGSVHQVDALEPSAFVDLLAPWYDDERVCSYYALEPGAPALLRRCGRED
jgi:hypothetical protein